MTVPLGFLYALVPVLVSGAIYFTSWIVRQLGKHAELLASASSKLEGQGDRLRRLEGWQDGFSSGRAVEKAAHAGESS